MVNSKGNKYRRSSSKGATLVELAMIFPIFVLGILFLVWLGILFGAKSSLDSSISRALALATTRGYAEGMGNDTISDIQEWNRSGAEPASLTDLLAYKVDWATARTFYDNTTYPVFHQPLQSMPPEYTYALVYINEAMKQGVGAVKYPCNSGPECLSCKFLNPDSLDDSEFPIANPIPKRRMAIECQYELTNSLIGPINGLMNLILGSANMTGSIIKKRQYLEVPEL